MSYDVWKKFEELANKLRDMGYYVELSRFDDEMFETYKIRIERDKSKNKNVDYFG